MNTASTDLTHHLKILKERLLHPTDFPSAFHYFMEEFGGDVAFIKMGEPETLPTIGRVVQLVASKTLGKEVRVENLRLSFVPGYGFHHGNALVGNHTAIVLFFESVNKGLIVIVPHKPGNAEFALFSLPGTMPMNPSAN